MSLTTTHRQQLDTQGWTVIAGIVSGNDCDRHQAYFTQWLSGFKKWPSRWASSWIGRFKSGHLTSSWEVRLAAKPVFAQIWRTQRLLSSMDAIDIGRPAEDPNHIESFHDSTQINFRPDQTADREGLHSIQGMVMLEQCDSDDWTIEVLEGSNKLFDEFMHTTNQWKCTTLDQAGIQWFEQRGCSRKRLSCPKGGIILCDSRLFRTDARPLLGRANPGRWRYLIYVCMTPASWATEEDLVTKRKAYEQMKMTTHWPSQKVTIVNSQDVKDMHDPYPDYTLPDVAKTEISKKLAGVLPYGDNEDDVDFYPTWNEDKWGEQIDEHRLSQMIISKTDIRPLNEHASSDIH